MSQSGSELSHNEDGQVRDRAIRLFSFLRALAQLRTETVRSIDAYEEVLWFDKIPEALGTYCVAWRTPSDEEQADVWLEIKKPELRSPPEVPAPLIPWLDPDEVRDSSRDLPNLRERIILPSQAGSEGGMASDSSPQVRDLADVPEMRTLWEEYVQMRWWPWAEEDRKLQAVQRVYADLFSIYKKQQQLGEAYEAVLGLGYLTWEAAKGPEVKRHLIVAQTSLMFDANRGIMTVGAAGEGARPTLEQDMLEVNERPPAATLADIEQKIEGLGDDLWPPDHTCEALRSWVHAASPRGQFDQTIIHQSECSPDPVVHLAPALILRKRPDRSLLRVFKEITEQLRSGAVVPEGVKRLITIVDDVPTGFGQAPSSATEKPGPVEEIQFPLPANEEQMKIVSQLSTRQGVLVQGPPGTGKSHTIANLVCHLLALGQRVLVTSHTARALKVLRERISAEIVPLCVILLGDDINAMQALEDSVRGITEQYNRWDPGRNLRLIAESERRLGEVRKAEALALAELRAIREAETFQHALPYGDYTGTAQTIAGQVKEEESRYSWLLDQVRVDGEAPLSDAEAIELLNLLRAIDDMREQELTKTVVTLDLLLDPDEFEAIVREEQEAAIAHERASRQRSHAAYSAALRASREQRSAIVTGLLSLLANIANLKNHAQPWVKDAIVQVLMGHRRRWEELLALTSRELESIEDRVREVSGWQVSGIAQRERIIVRAQASALLEHMEKGRTLGFGPFRPRVVKEGTYLMREVRVNGRLCNNLRVLRDLLELLRVLDSVDALGKHWTICTLMPSGSLEVVVAAYQDLRSLLAEIMELGRQVDMLRALISEVPGLPEPKWDDEEALKAFGEAVEAPGLEEALITLRTRFDDLKGHLSPIARSADSHVVVSDLDGAVTARGGKAYREAYEVLSTILKAREELLRRNALFQQLVSITPGLAANLKSTYADETWGERMPQFNRAWNWVRANRWLERLNDPKAGSRAAENLRRCRLTTLRSLGELAATRAWKHCLSRLTEAERQHLVAWQEAMKRVGKGTGKYASAHRRDARGHMEQCRSAIPAWIMPIYKVAETVRPGTDAFDVVIVDEASQSGPEALFLNYLAKKMIVVGDDQQISPDFVGVHREDVAQLRQQYINDLPHNDAIGVDTSFFTQAQIRYGGRIRLREHFRSMPEIIQFSNNLCYSSEPLIPLRQYGTDRLEPVVTAAHVPGGYQKGTSPRVINPVEADAITDKIAELCNTPRYEGKTMGVISLLGEDQAHYIEGLLVRRIGPEEMERRRLVCGDAYAFQGDERDVIFLSMVSAPTEGHRIGVLASERDKRRFNVAASRARDQMWLFHSVTLNDLSQQCLRRRLLEYCLKPRVEPSTIADLNVEHLRELAKSAERDRDRPPEPFGSWFEVDVFLMISERGYRVLPQFEIAGFRIDLAVEGIRGRLAVECDGDSWHGAEQYESDMGRQRDLERCGWVFWRVRGSAFYRDPQKALEELWHTLDLHGIYPVGKDLPIQAVEDSTRAMPRQGHSGREVFVPKATEPARPKYRIPQETDEGGGSEFEDDIATEIQGIGGQLSLSGTKGGDETEAGVVEEVSGSIGEPIYAKPYRKWRPRSLPDPRGADSKDVVPGLVEIIEAEGPILCHRAYRLYARAAGIAKVGRNVRSVLNRAIHSAVRQRLLEERNEYETRDQINQVVRLIGTRAVELRERGDRTLFEIPPSEIGAMMNLLARENRGLGGDDLLRAVLSQYGFSRMTANVRKLLLQIRERYSA